MRANRLGLNRRKYVAEMQQKKIKIPKPSTKLAWFLGVLAGDGYVSSLKDKSKSYRVLLIATNKEFVNQFAKIGKVLFGIKPNLRNYNKYKLKGKWKKYYECSFFSKAIVEFLGDWKENVWFNTLQDKFNWIWSNKYYISAFLSGFFDSDGSIRYEKETYTRRIAFAISNKNGQRVIKKMLEILGVKSKIYRNAIQIDGKENVKKLAFKIKSHILKKKNLIELMRSEL